MKKLFILRWQKNMPSAYSYGSVIRFEHQKSVYYSNPFLSPGLIIKQWFSVSDYLHNGNVPTLPNLKADVTYDLTANFESDNQEPLQIQVVFYNNMHQIIDKYQTIDKKLRFTVPLHMVSYEINLVNLKNQWIRFNYFVIMEVCDIDIQVNAEFTNYSDWVIVSEKNRAIKKANRIIFNKGIRTITPVSFCEKSNWNDIYFYTNAETINQLEAFNNLLDKLENDVNIYMGKGFLELSEEVQKHLYKKFHIKSMEGLTNE